MMQIVEMTDDEKMAMYMKLTKKELIEMLIQTNKHLENQMNLCFPVFGIPDIRQENELFKLWQL